MGYVIGLYGPANSGKDTVADYLLTKDFWDVKVSYATNLKYMCKTIFNLTDDEVNTLSGKESTFSTPKEFTQRNLGSVLFWMARTHSKYPLLKGSKVKISKLVGTKLYTPRQVLQFIGTDICRAVIPSYHLDIVTATLNENPNKNYVITDIRFPDEGNIIIDEFDGKVFKVKRDVINKGSTDRTHPSETSMSSWDRLSGIIENNTQSLTDLFDEVDYVLKGSKLCQETQSLRSQKENSSPTEEIEAPRDTGITQKTPLTDVG